MKTRDLIELNSALALAARKEGMTRKAAFDIQRNLHLLGPKVDDLRRKFTDEVEAAKGGRVLAKEELEALQQDLWAKGLDVKVPLEGLRKIEASGVPWEKLESEVSQMFLRLDLVEGEIKN